MTENSIYKMHADEIVINESLLSRMLISQFPQWAKLPISRVDSAGTDNTIYRLGDDMAIRFPHIHWASGQMEKEHKWLPRLAPYLPLSIPVPLAKGKPAESYPWQWSICKWIEGENAIVDRLTDIDQSATVIAQFVAAMQLIDPTGGPAPGSHNSGRGVPLAVRDTSTREAITSLQGIIDGEVATSAWEEALKAPVWNSPPVWIHGDLQSGNLLCVQGQLNAVIDFGCLGVGDPACDLIVAWNLLTTHSREVFRSELSVNDASWARGRGWALSIGVIALAYYLKTNPVLATISRYTIDEVLTDYNHRMQK